MCDYKTEITKIVNIIEIDKINCKNIIFKSLEFIRLLNIKIISNNIKNYNNNCVPIAIDLSCKTFDVFYNKSKLLSYIKNISISEYNRLINICKNILNLKINNKSTLDILLIRLDSTLLSKTNEILNKYEIEYINKLDKHRQQCINIHSSIYQAVAYYLAAKENNIKIDKRKVIEIAEVDMNSFNNLFTDMTNVVINNNFTENTNNQKENSNKRLVSKISKETNSNITILTNNTNRMNHSSDKTIIQRKILKAFDFTMNPSSNNNVDNINKILTTDRYNRLSINNYNPYQVMNIDNYVNDDNNTTNFKDKDVEIEEDEYQSWKESILKKRKLIDIEHTENT